MSDIQKRAYDKRLFDIDLGPAMRLEDTIAMIDEVVEVGTSDLTIADITHTGAVVTFSVIGGTAGGGNTQDGYQIAIRWATEGTPMQTLEAFVSLSVFDDHGQRA